MRNLYRVSHSRFDLSENALRSVRSGFAIDQNTDHKFYFVQDSGVYCCPLFVDREHPFCEPLLSQSDGYENIIALEHLALSDELCCASSSGNVWSCKLETGVVEEVTHCKHGIRAMQWSPDQELVVFVDGELNVVTMIGSEFEPINEVQLKDDTFGDRQFMSVGWGKKETQFHGSEGKAAAKKGTTPSEPDTAETERQLDATVNISWRADGEYFAVGYLAPFGQRAFKVFNKEGALQYTSEKCHGLEGSLAWRPSGNWIAIPQELKDRYVVALFEKNGLRHREIPLTLNPRAGQSVQSLHWSADSDVLAVHWVDGEQGTAGVLLYVIGNYHWYLKQSLTYPPGTALTGLQWDQRHTAGKTLHLFSSDPGVYECIRFDFRVDRSVGLSEEDQAMVAVIDGKRLLLTGFRQAVIPPPMCGYTLEQEHPINATGFIRTAGRSEALGQDISSNAFFTVDCRGEIILFDAVFTKTAGRSILSGVTVLLKISPEQLKMFNEDFPQQHHCGLHYLWLNADNFVMDHSQLRCGVYTIAMHNDVPGLKKVWHMEMENREEIGCIESSGADSILVELLSGHVMEVKGLTGQQDGALETSSRNHSVLPVFCEQLFVDRNRPERTVYALAQNRRHLYRDGSLLASDITSALLTDSYLLCTTISELKFIALGAAVVAPGRDPIIGERRVERGSKLVAVVARASRTIFQLPRGNLEAINPRVLSLCLIAKHLDALEYYEAFDIMRKERINLNLLVDHDPARFLQHLASHFLRQITNVNWLNLFISDLANQDACKMYESNYLDRGTGGGSLPDGYSIAEKVRFCSDRLLAAMDSEPTVLTLPKITCHVKQGQLENALALIWTLKQQQQSPEAAEEALRYLLYLVEVNVLYDVALGMYDFGLVLFVATKSQKDPKEYLPFLNELKRMEENYRKYRIDCHLKRYDRALEHIARYETDEDRFREALELITTHQLYGVALRCYRDSANQDHYRRVCAVYGDYLRKGSKHADASLMYERAGDLQQAISSARHALDWRRVVRLSTDSSVAVEAVLRSLVPGLLEAGEYDAAATIAHDHLKDARLAIECLVKDHRYERALLLATEPELHEAVRSSVGEYLTTLIETLCSEKEQFLRQKDRLSTVREDRIRKQSAAAAAGDLDDGDGDCGDCDLFSDSSTIASSRHTGTSGRSGKSHRSSKNRRKHERKLLNLKEGNPFEDIALIDALHSLVVRVCGVERQRHVRSICQVAMELCYDDEAHKLQEEYGALFQLIRYSLDAIWVPEMIVPGMPPTIGSGGDAAAIGDVPATILTPADLVKAQDSQRYSLIKPHQRYKPEVQSIAWQWDILK
ncbi:putative elongator complex protein 1 [Anopheles arabiensis]|uniref:putative elongator complex protein 1 n=1 Tax=Anopheles arabiensis TaxID=7173 RepID=UPI001AAD189D|nr:putative elongator complex protein 1 [Anopheles arabiensis]